MRLPRLPAYVWMSLPLLALLAACLLLLAAPDAQAQAPAPVAAERGCQPPVAAPVQVVVDDASQALDPRDPYFAEKLAARYRALSAPAAR